MSTTTLTAFAPGDRVCRSSERRQIIGIVKTVFPTSHRVRVYWPKHIGGLRQSGRGVGKTMLLRVDELIPAEDYVPHVEPELPEWAWRANTILVMADDGNGAWQYGRDVWSFRPDEEDLALDVGRRLAGEGKPVRIQRQDKAVWTPDGCSNQCVKFRWVTVFKA